MEKEGKVFDITLSATDSFECSVSGEKVTLYTGEVLRKGGNEAVAMVYCPRASGVGGCKILRARCRIGGYVVQKSVAEQVLKGSVFPPSACLK